MGQQPGMGGDMAAQAAYAQTAQKLYASGVEAPAVVHTIRPTGQTDVGGGQQTEFDVSIRPAGGEPYQTTISQSMLPAQLEEISEGAPITVRTTRTPPPPRSSTAGSAMGLFKGIRDVKRMSDHHGGMPSVRQSFKDIGAWPTTAASTRCSRRARRPRAWRRASPSRCPATASRCRSRSRCTRPTAAPYTVNYVFPTTRMKAAVTVGMEIPVKVHPDDPNGSPCSGTPSRPRSPPPAATWPR